MVRSEKGLRSSNGNLPTRRPGEFRYCGRRRIDVYGIMERGRMVIGVRLVERTSVCVCVFTGYRLSRERKRDEDT